ncbi:hypothetical protein EYF80_062611 [Liparis tanakae]|uniref:Uncharacterized protein n=1 Tax=Liparis tanakae TaxID=230148 RepID=A0A4Z2EEE6_9TELE|nr:hypothetical protein EYF80_062611 [Liparis tanakae]
MWLLTVWPSLRRKEQQQSKRERKPLCLIRPLSQRYITGGV